MMNDYEYSDQMEDHSALVEPTFDIEPNWWYELDLEYMQGEM